MKLFSFMVKNWREFNLIILKVNKSTKIIWKFTIGFLPKI